MTGKHIQISIDNPCSEKIENMTPTSCGAFCHTCSKEVVDFTGFTDTELIDWLKRHPLGCGTFRADQLNKPIPLYEIEPNRKPFKLWAAILTTVSLLNIREAKAQQTKTQKPLTVVDASSAAVSDSIKKQEPKQVVTEQPIRAADQGRRSTLAVGIVSVDSPALNIRGDRSASTVYIIDGKVVHANGKPAPYKRPNFFRRFFAWLF